MKKKKNMFFWRLNNELQTYSRRYVRLFCPILSRWAFIRGWYFAEKCLKMVIFRVLFGGWAFIRTWAFIRDFTVHRCLPASEISLVSFYIHFAKNAI